MSPWASMDTGSIHRKITGYYNSAAKKVFPNAADGLRVRDVVKEWSYKDQYNFGIGVIEMHGGGEALKNAGIKRL